MDPEIVSPVGLRKSESSHLTLKIQLIRIRGHHRMNEIEQTEEPFNVASKP